MDRKKFSHCLDKPSILKRQELLLGDVDLSSTYSSPDMIHSEGYISYKGTASSPYRRGGMNFNLCVKQA
jgi:hypothetical protein